MSPEQTLERIRSRVGSALWDWLTEERSGSGLFNWTPEDIQHLLTERDRLETIATSLAENLDVYQVAAKRTSCLNGRAPMDTRVIPGPELPEGIRIDRVDHAITGLAAESGELAEHLKHVRFHGHPLQVDELIKELGDQFWYLAEAATGLNVKISAVLQRNIDKLRARYPDGFSTERSLNRNTSKE